MRRDALPILRGCFRIHFILRALLGNTSRVLPSGQVTERKSLASARPIFFALFLQPIPHSRH